MPRRVGFTKDAACTARWIERAPSDDGSTARISAASSAACARSPTCSWMRASLSAAKGQAGDFLSRDATSRATSCAGASASAVSHALAAPPLSKACAAARSDSPRGVLCAFSLSRCASTDFCKASAASWFFASLACTSLSSTAATSLKREVGRSSRKRCSAACASSSRSARARAWPRRYIASSACSLCGWSFKKAVKPCAASSNRPESSAARAREKSSWAACASRSPIAVREDVHEASTTTRSAVRRRVMRMCFYPFLGCHGPPRPAAGADRRPSPVLAGGPPPAADNSLEEAPWRRRLSRFRTPARKRPLAERSGRARPRGLGRPGTR